MPSDLEDSGVIKFPINRNNGAIEKLCQSNENAYQLYCDMMKEPDPDKIIIHKKDKTKRQSAKAFPRGSKYRGVSKNGSKWQVSAKFI